MPTDIIPRSDAEFVVWFDNFKIKFPTPEVRQYRLRYLKNDEQVGIYSDILNVTTLPNRRTDFDNYKSS